jgi:hypothetical protein
MQTADVFSAGCHGLHPHQRWRFAAKKVIIEKQVLSKIPSNTLSTPFSYVIREFIASPDVAARVLRFVSRCGWRIPGVPADVV